VVAGRSNPKSAARSVSRVRVSGELRAYPVMANLSEADWARLAQYFAGACTPAEADEVRRWIEADLERQRLVEDLRAAWDAAATPGTAWDTPAAWQRLSGRLRSRERRAPAALVRARRPAHRGNALS